MNMTTHEWAATEALLSWYLASGVDDCVAPEPTNAFAAPPLTAETEPLAGRLADRTPAEISAPKRAPSKQPVVAMAARDVPPADEAIALAHEQAMSATTIDMLTAAVFAFNGCALKKGARNTVFIDGCETGDLLVIGEGPGRDEDRLGKPFVGRAGQLLDRMLAAIDRSRETNTLISNAVFWRPPGNRTPTGEETAICRPFVMRLIELQRPRAVVLAGGAAMETLIGISGIMRNRGAWHDITLGDGTRVPALPIFHPAFLLRQPLQKRLAWQDLQNLSARLKNG